MRKVAALAALFGLAVGLRLAVIHDLSALPSMHALVEDAAAYDAMARRLLESGGLPETAFYQDPLYPYFLAACYATLGDSFVAVRLLHALMGGVTAVLLALAALRLGGGRLGAAVAGLLAAGYAPLLFYGPLLQKETLLVLLESGFVLAALTALGSVGIAWAGGAGLLLGLATLLRGNLVLVAPLAAAGLVVAARRRAPAVAGAWRPGIAFAVGVGLALLPVTLLNHHVSGEWIVTTSQSGANFYLGNRLGASGLYEPLRPGRQTPAQEQQDARRVAAEVLGRERGASVDPGSLTPAEVSRALWRESGRDLASAPGAWLAGLGRKLLFAWNRLEIPDAEAFDVYRAESRWLAASPITFPWVASLGIAGLVALRRRCGARYLAVLVAGLSVSVALFFVFARYRLALVPLLVPLAGAGLAELAVAWRAGERRRLAVWAAAAVATLVVACWPSFDTADRAAWAAVTHANLATAANRLGAEVVASDPDRALGWYAEGERRGRAAVAADPDYLPARLALVVSALRRGNLHLARGERASAAAAYDQAESALDELLASPQAPAYPEVVENARSRLRRALAGGRAALAGSAPPLADADAP